MRHVHHILLQNPGVTLQNGSPCDSGFAMIIFLKEVLPHSQMHSLHINLTQASNSYFHILSRRASKIRPILFGRGRHSNNQQKTLEKP
jgi:hypothetical protein